MAARCIAAELEALGQARGAAEYRMRSQADKDSERWDAAAKNVSFNVSDLVLLARFKYNWEGPYQVLKMNTDTDVYWLETLGGVVRNDWIHVDRLKKAKTAEELLELTPWFEVSSSRRLVSNIQLLPFVMLVYLTTPKTTYIDSEKAIISNDNIILVK